jgi:hypothetical protein
MIANVEERGGELPSSVGEESQQRTLSHRLCEHEVRKQDATHQCQHWHQFLVMPMESSNEGSRCDHRRDEEQTGSPEQGS